MKNAGKTLLSAAGMLLASVTAGMLLLMLVQLVPGEAVRQNVLKAGAVFEKEGAEPSQEIRDRLPDWNESHPNVYPTWMIPWCNAYLDNQTDALMLLTAAYGGGEGIVEKAVMAKRELVEGHTTTQSIIRLAEAEKTGEELPLVTESYPRYWHGYLVFLRPLLALFDYSGIRVILGITETLLAAATVLVLIRGGRKKWIPLYLLLWLMSFPAVLARSLQYSCIYLIYTLGDLLILAKWEKWKSGNSLIYVFLGLGIAAAYFDLLTYPVAALGIPLVTVFLCRGFVSGKEDLLCLLKLGAAFALGYAGMWAGKWILTWLIYGPEIFASVTETIAFRTSHSGKGGEPISLLSMYVRNLGGFVLNPGVVLALLIFFGLVAVRIKRRSFRLQAPLAFSLIALFPFAWLLVTANHAYIHSYFTCRSFLVTGFALLAMLRGIPSFKKTS